MKNHISMKWILAFFLVVVSGACHGQVFVFTADSVYRCDEIKPNRAYSDLYSFDSTASELILSRRLDQSTVIELIAFSNAKAKNKFENRTNLQGVQYRVLDPLPTWLMDSTFTGPVENKLFQPDLGYRSVGYTTKKLLHASGVLSENDTPSTGDEAASFITAAGYEMERALRKKMAAAVILVVATAIGTPLLTVGIYSGATGLAVFGGTVAGIGGTAATVLYISRLQNELNAAKYLQQGGMKLQQAIK